LAEWFSLNDFYLTLSALQHYSFCPRQFALIHIEQSWEENYFTAEGRVLHERVDSGAAEQRGVLRYERGVLLISHEHKIQGKMDLLEIEKINGATRYFPVEYKRGKPKTEDWDKIQVCAQALCLEEMRNTQVTEGSIWYWEVRKREPITIDDRLRLATIETINNARKLLIEGKTPKPIAANKSRCRACSLIEICQPKTFRQDHSAQYIADLFTSTDDAEAGVNSTICKSDGKLI
jgi:CRISPR-associated exonuclease Cas4